MKFWQRYWYYIGGVAFVILAFAMGLWGSAALDYVQVLLIFSWMGMLVHQSKSMPGRAVFRSSRT